MTRGFAGAFVQHWLMLVRPSEVGAVLFNAMALTVVVAWLAGGSGDSAIVAAAAVGVALLAVWRAATFQVGFLLLESNAHGVLELERVSPTPVLVIMLGKLVATIGFYCLIGLVSLPVALLVAEQPLYVPNPLTFAVSITVVIVAIMATVFFFAPFTFVIGGRPGFFNAVIPIGVLLGSFVQPVDLLPATLRVAAGSLSTSWAMEAVRMSLSTPAPLSRLGLLWLTSLVLSAATVGVTCRLFLIADSRLRRTGSPVHA